MDLHKSRSIMLNSPERPVSNPHNCKKKAGGGVVKKGTGHGGGHEDIAGDVGWGGGFA